MRREGYTFEQTVAAFWSRVERSEGCWFWCGSVSSGRYGNTAIDGKYVYAHRFSFFLANGRWPKHDADHICHNKLCVRPDHIRDVTHRENMNSRRCSKICKRGHKLEGDNLYTYSNGTRRRCKTCIPIMMAAWKAKVAARKAK